MADTLDIGSLKRNPEKIKKCFKIVGNSTVATSDIKIIFPKRFIDKGFCKLDKLTTLLAYYAILDTEDNYAITIAPVAQQLQPSSISMLNIGKSEKDVFICLNFYKDDVVIPNNDCVQDASYFFGILDEFFLKGKIPWYMNYEDVSNMILESERYAGSNIGSNPLGLEILATLVAKDKYGKAYKNSITSANYIFTHNPSYTGLGDVRSYTDTGSKLIGSRLKDGLTSALIEKETKTSDVSSVLRA